MGNRRIRTDPETSREPNFAINTQGDLTDQVLGNSDLHRLVGHAKDGDDLSDSVRSVVEEEEGVVV